MKNYTGQSADLEKDFHVAMNQTNPLAELSAELTNSQSTPVSLGYLKLETIWNFVTKSRQWVKSCW